MRRRALLGLAIVTMSTAVPLLCRAAAPLGELHIRADKLVYLERGEVAEFRKNVVFERDDFKGRSRYLKLDKKKNKIFASGAVSGDIFNSGRGDMSFATEKLFYEEASGAVFSPDKSDFVVNVSTTATKDIYTINCSSFSGNIPNKQFHLTGKPVTIKGEKLSGFSDTLDCSPTVTEMRGNARLDYFEPPVGDAQNAPVAGRSPWNADANYIKMSFESEEYEFKGDVTGVFYPKNAENP
ncbi:hypothetical protein KKF70_00635 [bacterium]|nr:hypothetical protein [bacterium]MBU3929233.1 hypothetical protein [bacterium]MBU4123642.1 hypothetical protein [bacterium]